jgi:hypothetical protein
MNATAFYITLVTTQGVDLAEYDEVASVFVKAFYIVTSEHLTEFTKPHLTDTRCEVEVMASADSDSKYTVQAVAILQAKAPKPWTLDKNKLTALLRNEIPFAFKLSKRAVDKAEIAAAIQDAAADAASAAASNSKIVTSSSSE